MAQNDEIRYLTPQGSDQKKKKYCRFKKSGIKYIDYKDPEFLKKFLNEQGSKARSCRVVSPVLRSSINAKLLRPLRKHATWHCCLT